MTDNEIIKALGICIGDMNCLECPYVDKDEENKLCNEKLFADVCDLIKSQNAKIERLKLEVEVRGAELSRYTENLPRMIETAKSEAIKEFAKRLKMLKCHYSETEYTFDFDGVTVDDIDNLVKEMTEDEGE